MYHRDGYDDDKELTLKQQAERLGSIREISEYQANLDYRRVYNYQDPNTVYESKKGNEKLQLLYMNYEFEIENDTNLRIMIDISTELERFE